MSYSINIPYNIGNVGQTDEVARKNVSNGAQAVNLTVEAVMCPMGLKQ